MPRQLSVFSVGMRVERGSINAMHLPSLIWDMCMISKSLVWFERADGNQLSVSSLLMQSVLRLLNFLIILLKDHHLVPGGI